MSRAWSHPHGRLLGRGSICHLHDIDDVSSTIHDTSTILNYHGVVVKTRRLSDEEEQTWRALQLMQMRLSAELSRQLAEDSNLSYPDYIVLVALSAQPSGRMRILELAKLIGWEKSRLSHHVGRMGERRLIDREQCDSDRRGAYVAITPQGRHDLEKATPGHVDAVRRLFIDQLTDEQLAVIRLASETTLARIEAT